MASEQSGFPSWVRSLGVLVLALGVVGILALITHSLAGAGGGRTYAVLAFIWIISLAALRLLLPQLRATVWPHLVRVVPAPSTRVSDRLIKISSVLFFCSLFLHCVCTGVSGSCLFGFWVLLTGWIEIASIGDVGPFIAFCWFANPCVFMTWVLLEMDNRKWGVRFGIIGLVLGLAYLFGKNVVTGADGNPHTIIGYGAGYWVWVCSLGLALAAALMLPQDENLTPSKPGGNIA